MLLAMMYLQKNLINKFSDKAERLEMLFNDKSEILSIILEEKDYILVRYSMQEEKSLDNKFFIITIEKSTHNQDEFFKDKFIEYLKFKIPDINEEMLNFNDYTDANKVLLEWCRGLKFFTFSLAFVLVTVLLVLEIKLIISRVKRDLKNYYIEELVKNTITDILEELIKLTVLLFSEIFLLQWLIKFKFNISGRYLPANNIFDFKFYQNLENLSIIALSCYGNSYHNVLYGVKMLALIALIIVIILFLITITTIVKYFKNKYMEINGEMI
jgi:hypothetical protein